MKNKSDQSGCPLRNGAAKALAMAMAFALILTLSPAFSINASAAGTTGYWTDYATTPEYSDGV